MTLGTLGREALAAAAGTTLRRHTPPQPAPYPGAPADTRSLTTRDDPPGAMVTP